MNIAALPSARPFSDSAIGRVIEELYQETDIAPPSAAYPIAPLASLFDRLLLRCIETAPLTSRIAETLLWERRALADRAAFSAGDDAPLAGYLYATGQQGFVFVSQADPVTRRRFSIAHELGHFLLHCRPVFQAAALDETLDIPLGLSDAFAQIQADAAEGEPSDSTNAETFLRQEREANTFAAALLMPSDVVAALCKQEARTANRSHLAARLATTLLVSREAIRIRLEQFDRLQKRGG